MSAVGRHPAPSLHHDAIAAAAAPGFYGDPHHHHAEPNGLHHHPPPPQLNGRSIQQFAAHQQLPRMDGKDHHAGIVIPPPLAGTPGNTTTGSYTSSSGLPESQRSYSSSTLYRTGRRSARHDANVPLSQTNIYIRGLPQSYDGDQLRQLCEPYGEIVSTKAVVDPETQCCRGYGFVDFADADSASRALQAINENGVFEAEMAKEIRGRVAEKHLEQDPTNLYMANLPRDYNETTIRDMLSDHGMVISTRVLRNPDGSSRCVGFARMESKEACDAIIAHFNGKRLDENCDELVVKLADSGGRRPKHSTSSSGQSSELSAMMPSGWSTRTGNYAYGATGYAPDGQFAFSPIGGYQYDPTGMGFAAAAAAGFIPAAAMQQMGYPSKMAFEQMVSQLQQPPPPQPPQQKPPSAPPIQSAKSTPTSNTADAQMNANVQPFVYQQAVPNFAAMQPIDYYNAVMASGGAAAQQKPQPGGYKGAQAQQFAAAPPAQFYPYTYPEYLSGQQQYMHPYSSGNVVSAAEYGYAYDGSPLYVGAQQFLPANYAMAAAADYQQSAVGTPDQQGATSPPQQQQLLLATVTQQPPPPHHPMHLQSQPPPQHMVMQSAAGGSSIGAIHTAPPSLPSGTPQNAQAAPPPPQPNQQRTVSEEKHLVADMDKLNLRNVASDSKLNEAAAES